MTSPRYLPHRSVLPLLTLLLGLVTLPACSGDVVEQTSGIAAGGGGGAGGSGGSGGVGGSGGSGGSVESGGTGGTGGTGGGAVGCTQKEDCGENEYCRFADHRCGEGEAQGVCTVRPLECAFVQNHVCSCSGKVQYQDCPQMQDAIDISVNGNCTPPEGTFACGYTFCKAGASYCMETTNSGFVHYSCVEFPAPCNDADECSCIHPGLCPGVTCATNAEGHAVVACVN